MEVQEGEVVLCTVERIERTSVFVKIHGFQKDLEGSIITSEIAPGRIRNLRDYVVPNKRIVCKVLRISGNSIELSLRRVTKKEQKEVLEEYSQEKSYASILKSILKEKSEKIIKEIEDKQRLYEFIQEAKENPKELENLVGKEDSKKILEILKIHKSKKTEIKKEFEFSSSNPNGIEQVKKILGEIKNVKILYISAGKYQISIESEDLKKADQELENILKEISEKAKKLGMTFRVK